jgi:dUTP pyrophosphatase
MSIVQLKFLCEGARRCPSKATVGSAAYDICAEIPSPLMLMPLERMMIGSGFALDMSRASVHALLLPRSGLGSKGIILANSVGLIDSDYQGEIKVCLWNTSSEPYTIQPQERIAQIVFLSGIHTPEFFEVENFEPTDRGPGGFGSTGNASIEENLPQVSKKEKYTTQSTDIDLCHTEIKYWRDQYDRIAHEYINTTCDLNKSRHVIEALQSRLIDCGNEDFLKIISSGIEND